MHDDINMQLTALKFVRKKQHQLDKLEINMPNSVHTQCIYAYVYIHNSHSVNIFTT